LASQQPPQTALLGHCPPQPSLALAHLPAHWGVHVPLQLPLTQLWVSVHASQGAPFIPHAAFQLPGWQVSVASQQPAQPLLSEHVPPQPSPAPAHLSLQSGVQVPPQTPSPQPAPPQSIQASPFFPQVAAWFPAKHVPLLQHPTQLLGPQLP